MYERSEEPVEGKVMHAHPMLDTSGAAERSGWLPAGMPVARVQPHAVGQRLSNGVDEARVQAYVDE